MKRFTIILLALVTFAALFGCSEQGANDSSLRTVKDRRAFLMGFDNTNMPCGFHDANGTYMGLDLDIGKEIAKRMGVTLNIQIIKKETSISQLLGKSIDYLGNSAVSSASDEVVYSDIVYKDKVVVAIPGDSAINAIAAFDGKKVAIASAYSDVADELKLRDKIEIIDVYDPAAALKELESGNVEAIIVPETFVLYKNKNGGNLRALDKELKQIECKMVFRKGDTALVASVNEFLKEMKADGSLEAMFANWVGKSLS